MSQEVPEPQETPQEEPQAQETQLRVFHYDGRDFPDPDPAMSAEDVRVMMTDFFPELANADINEHKRENDTLFEFVRKVGTKGP